MELIGYPSIVVAGAWNRRILTPDWFYSEFSDLPKPDDKRLEVELNSGFFKFEINDMEINPQSTKLIIFAKKRDEGTYKSLEMLTRNTVSKLRHTPFHGVGHNLEYQINEKEGFELFSDDVLDSAESFYKDKAGAIVLTQYESIHRIGYEDYTLNLTYHVSKNEKKVLFNYHYPTTDYRKISKYVECFRKNIEYSKTLISSLVK